MSQRPFEVAAHKAPSREALQAQCDAFNFECAVGGPVAVKLDGRDKPLITTTRSEAQVLSGHSAVVWLDGVSGCYLLERVAPIPRPAPQHLAPVITEAGARMLRQHLESALANSPGYHMALVPGDDVLALLDNMRAVPRLPTPKQLRAALRHTSDAELAKSIYLAMTSAEAITPEGPTTRIQKGPAQ
jgi:hypothetical protein